MRLYLRRVHCRTSLCGTCKRLHCREKNTEGTRPPLKKGGDAVPRLERSCRGSSECDCETGHVLCTVYCVLCLYCQVFGAMLPCALRVSETFYGNGEAYLFSFYDGFKVRYVMSYYTAGGMVVIVNYVYLMQLMRHCELMRINAVALHRARLVLGWVTAFGQVNCLIT